MYSGLGPLTKTEQMVEKMFYQEGKSVAEIALKTSRTILQITTMINFLERNRNEG